MKTTVIRETKARKPPVPVTKQRETRSLPPTISHPSMATCEDLYGLISKRAYERYSARGCRDGSALDDWLDAEREILSQIRSV